jgi:phosphoglycolate phosphatase
MERNNEVLFLFDYDGVIADSFDSLLEVCIKAQSTFGEGRTPTAEDFRTIDNLTFNELGRIIGIPKNKCVSYAERALELQQTNWKTHPFPQIIDVISKLAIQHTVAIVTNSQSDIVTASLEEFGIGAAIAGVIGGDSGTNKTDRILYLKATHASTAETTYMIGDTVGDIRAGKHAGVQTAAVTWGFQESDLLRRESPNYLLKSPKELLSIVPGCVSPAAKR